VPDYRQALDRDIRGMRIGVMAEELNHDLVEPETREAVAKATTVLAELGAVVEEVSLPLTRHAALLSTIPLLVEPASNHRQWVRDRLEDYGHNNRIGLLTGSIMPAQAYYKAQKLRTLLRQQVHEALKDYDVLVLPTSGKTAQRIQEDPRVTSKERAFGLPYLFTRIFNLASAPAISLPCGFSSAGLPIGLQIGGPSGGEETILRVAHAYERSTPWHTMRPPTV
jgi:aspartyl-tRNA(Asn)/glutamyl-tRNA(Gln) amidotransferase subunit A